MCMYFQLLAYSTSSTSIVATRTRTFFNIIMIISNYIRYKIVSSMYITIIDYLISPFVCFCFVCLFVSQISDSQFLIQYSIEIRQPTVNCENHLHACKCGSVTASQPRPRLQNLSTSQADFTNRNRNRTEIIIYIIVTQIQDLGTSTSRSMQK